MNTCYWNALVWLHHKPSAVDYVPVTAHLQASYLIISFHLCLGFPPDKNAVSSSVSVINKLIYIYNTAVNSVIAPALADVCTFDHTSKLSRLYCC